jgi:flagellar hook-length control protein FliK
MSAALPLPALLVSRSPQVDQRSLRADGTSSRQVTGNDLLPRKAKFADALGSAASASAKKSPKPRDAAREEPALGARNPDEKPMDVEPAGEAPLLNQVADKPITSEARSAQHESSEQAPSSNQPAIPSGDSRPQSSAPVAPPAPVAQPSPNQIFQPQSTQPRPVVDDGQAEIQVQGQRQNTESSSAPPAPAAIDANRRRQALQTVAEFAAHRAAVQPKEIPPASGEQPADQRHDEPRQPQPAVTNPLIDEDAATPQRAREAMIAHAAVTPQSGSIVERDNNRASVRQTPSPTPSPKSERPSAQPAPRTEVQPQQAMPAVARAVQIEATMRGEHPMGQAMPGEHATLNSAAAPHVVNQPTLAPAPSLHLKSDNLAQQLPGFSAPIDDAPLAGQVVRGLSAMVNQRGGTMNLRLDPPDLGQLRIQMTVTRGVVTAEFHPTTPQAHDLLERNLAALRSTLEGQGLTVERLNVHVAAPSGQQQLMRDDSNANTPNQQRHNHDAAGGESRGRRDGQQQEFHREYAFADFQNLLNDLDQFALR